MEQRGLIILPISAVLMLGACAMVPADSGTRMQTAAYAVEAGDSRLARFAPVFVIEHEEHAYNHVGTPKARLDDHGREEVYVDPGTPGVYAEELEFSTERGTYTNLVYRIHFPRSPFTWKPFNTGAGRNMGFMAVITLDEKDRPLYVNTVQSCGCYHAIIPTNLADPATYPAEWDTDGINVFGERLPALLEYPEPVETNVKLIIRIRSATHRAMDIRTMPAQAIREQFETISTGLRPMDALKHLPLGGGETSFYFTEGRKRGLVKGAIKPWESVLLGWLIGDAHVGQDREYGPKSETGRRFYTSLNPLKKRKADMADYAGFLRLNGWKL